MKKYVVSLVIGCFVLGCLGQIHANKKPLSNFHSKQSFRCYMEINGFVVTHDVGTVCPKKADIEHVTNMFYKDWNVKDEFKAQFEGYILHFAANRIDCPGNPIEWVTPEGQHFRGYTGCSDDRMATIMLNNRATVWWKSTVYHEICHRYGTLLGVSDEFHKHRVRNDKGKLIWNSQEGFCFERP